MNKGRETLSCEWINFMNAGDGFYKVKILKIILSKNYFENVDRMQDDLSL
jgi:hypothetical protein